MKTDLKHLGNSLFLQHLFVFFFLATLSALATFLVLTIFHIPLSHHTILVQQEPQLSKAYYFFPDLNHDGLSETVVLKKETAIKQPAIKVYNPNGGLIDQWNFSEDWLTYPVFGDYDGDMYDEIFVFTHSADSLFLYVLDARKRSHFLFNRLPVLAAPAQNFNHHKKGEWDLFGSNGLLLDVDGDGYKDLVFNLNVGYAVVPRWLFAYSIRKKKIIATSPKFAANLNLGQLADLNGDGQLDILPAGASAPCNVFKPFPYRDDRTWIMAFQKNLDFLFPPIPMPKGYSKLITIPYRNGKGSFIVAYWINADAVNRIPKLYLISGNGTILKEKAIESARYDAHIFTLPGLRKDRLFYLDYEKGLFELNSTFEILRHVAIKKHPLITYALLTVDSDPKSKLIMVTKTHLGVMNLSNFEQTWQEIPKSKILVSPAVKWFGHNDSEIVLQLKDFLLYCRYRVNPLFFFRYFIVFTIFGILFAGNYGLYWFLNTTSFHRQLAHFAVQQNQLGVLVLDSRKKIKMANDHAKNLLKPLTVYGAGEHFSQVFPKDSKIYNFFEQLGLQKNLVQTEISSVFLENNKHLNLYSTPVRGLFKLPIGHVVFIDSMQTNNQLERVRVWSKTIQKIAHDIKTPLSTIQIGLQTLQMKINDLLPEKSAVQEDFDILLSELRRLRELTRNFLQFANLESPNKQIVSIRKILTRVLSRFSHYFNEDLRIQIELDDEHDRLMADPQQLEVVFQSIIENAIDALHGEGILFISSSMAQYLDKHFVNYLEIDFADTGQGMDKETQKRVFDPYFTTKSEGTGMGLTIARKIIEDHGGEIVLTSRKGFATVVRVMLPIGNIGDKHVA
ncbi:MAG: hypothetical protein GXO76_15090 [Calditrichaeota bacterium]|nr:hypothetical protein [Calditrichota bacterium]